MEKKLVYLTSQVSFPPFIMDPHLNCYLKVSCSQAKIDGNFSNCFWKKRRKKCILIALPLSSKKSIFPYINYRLLNTKHENDPELKPNLILYLTMNMNMNMNMNINMKQRSCAMYYTNPFQLISWFLSFK